MPTLVSDTTKDQPAPFANILTGLSGRALGQRFGGQRSGPTLLIATGPGLFDPLVRRLEALPNLSWMRGEIVLVRLSDVGEELSDVWIDDILTLPQLVRTSGDITDAYWTVLRKATAMGMIDGRGVPAVRVA